MDSASRPIKPARAITLKQADAEATLDKIRASFFTRNPTVETLQAALVFLKSDCLELLGEKDLQSVYLWASKHGLEDLAARSETMLYDTPRRTEIIRRKSTVRHLTDLWDHQNSSEDAELGIKSAEMTGDHASDLPNAPTPQAMSGQAGPVSNNLGPTLAPDRSLTARRTKSIKIDAGNFKRDFPTIQTMDDLKANANNQKLLDVGFLFRVVEFLPSDKREEHLQHARRLTSRITDVDPSLIERFAFDSELGGDWEGMWKAGGTLGEGKFEEIERETGSKEFVAAHLEMLKNRESDEKASPTGCNSET